MANVIKQIVRGDGYTQSIKMLVRDNERGPQGEQGERGEAATITAGNAYSVPNGSPAAVVNTGSSTDAVFDFYIPKGDKGDQGEPGVVQYKAGRGIRIIDNTIYATGVGPGGGGAWGEIIGDINDQTDLQQEFGKYTPTADLATVATTGSYDDLTDKPVIPTPTPQVQSDWDQTNSSAVDYIKNKPTIPVMPTVNDAVLTINQNGTQVATFSANSATNATANITAPEIIMTTTDPGEGETLAANNYVAVYGGDPIIMDYSTSEVNTGAKWVNGYAIYKKTISFGALPNAAEKEVAHNITNLRDVVKIETICQNSSSQTAHMVNSCYGNPNAGVGVLEQVYLNDTNIFMRTGTDRTAFNAYVTVYYTKSA